MRNILLCLIVSLAVLASPAGAVISNTLDYFPPAEGITTTDATPVDITLFEITNNATMIGRLMLVARRPSDGASKGWDITSVAKRQGGVVTNLANAGGGAPIASAGDLTALLLVTIAFFKNDSTGETGVTITGLAGTTIEWTLRYSGLQIID